MRTPHFTSAELRGEIDAGRTGDKASGFDPAAAPLGTDAEAGGVQTDEALLRNDLTTERAARPAHPAPNASTPDLTPDGEAPPTPYIAPLLMGAGLAGMLAAVFLALL